MGAPQRGRPANLRLRIVDPAHAPLRGVTVDVRPAGDRMGGHRPGASVSRVSDADGYVSVPWPATTHVAVSCRGHESVSTAFVPDFVASLDFVVHVAWHPVYTLPTGICQDAAELEATPVDRRNGKPFALFRVCPLSNGRTLYASNVAPGAVGSRHQLRETSGKEDVGTYDLAEWVWSGDVSELRPRFASPPADFRLPRDVVARLAELLPRESRRR